MAATMMIAAFATAACEDEPDKYEVAGGLPVVKYVRTPQPPQPHTKQTPA